MCLTAQSSGVTVGNKADRNTCSYEVYVGCYILAVFSGELKDEYPFI